MKKCDSCFRFVENWRDVEEKGLIERPAGLLDYKYKPRKGVKTLCTDASVKEDVCASHKACKNHMYRWAWNLDTWWNWKFKQSLCTWYRQNVKMRIGGLRKPVQLKYADYYNGFVDAIIPGGEPMCPHCGEMPYSYTQCKFCGQRFSKSEKLSIK